MVGQQSVYTQLQPAKVVKRQKVAGTDTWWVVITTVRPSDLSAPPAPPAEIGPYTHTPEAPEALKLMDERLERNKMKNAVGNPAVVEVGSEVITSEVVSE
jgi:hypothetical protein